MKKLIYITLISFFWACSPEELISPYPCLSGNCESFFEIDPLVSPGVYQDTNGYFHIEHQGINYFTVQGQLDELHSDYIVNGIPLVETAYDSDYWIWVNGITFTVPLYSILGYFTSGNYGNPIPIGNITYTIEDMANNHPPLNIVGYSYNPDSGFESLGTYSKYNYQPRQQIFFDNQMVGDTAKIIIETKYPEDIIVNKELNIIFE